MVCDSKSAIYLVYNSTFHERRKHIELDCHVIREKLQLKLIYFLSISTTTQMGDIFTKPLYYQALSPTLVKLGLFSIHNPTLRGYISLSIFNM